MSEEGKRFASDVQAVAAKVARFLSTQSECREEISVAIGALVETLCPIVVSTMPAAEAEPFIQRAVALWFEGCRSAADRHFFETQNAPKGRPQ